MTDASTVDAGQGADQQQDQQQQDGPDAGKSLLGREGQQQQDLQQQEGPPEWLSALPEELRGDATLQRFKSLEDLARGHIEAHKVAKSKVMLPSEADPDSFARFAAAIRPEAADKYTIEVPDGEAPDTADAMRPVFYEAGLHPQQAEIVVKGWNAFRAQEMAAAEQKGQDELDALEAEMGAKDFERGKLAAARLLDQLGVPISFENGLARFVGEGNTLRVLFSLAERAGELGRVDATDLNLALGNLKGEAAREKAREMVRNDKDGKLTDPSSPERQLYDRLIAASVEE